MSPAGLGDLGSQPRPLPPYPVPPSIGTEATVLCRPMRRDCQFKVRCPECLPEVEILQKRPPLLQIFLLQAGRQATGGSYSWGVGEPF